MAKHAEGDRLPRRAITPADQEDAWLAACRMVGHALGIEFTSPASRDLQSGHHRLSAIATASGVRMRAVALTDRWWREDVGPLVGRREQDGAPMVLMPVSPRRYRLYDPVAGTNVPVTEQMAASLHPFAWCFYRPLPVRALKGRDLVRFGLVGCRRDVAEVVVMGLGAGGLATVLPLATGVVFDSIVPGGDRRQLLVIALLMVIAAVCASMFHVAQAFALQRMEARMDASLQAAIWDRLLSLPVRFFRAFTAGDLANRSFSITAMRQIATGSVISSVLAGVFSIFSFVVLFYYSWTLALLAAGLTAVMLLLTAVLGALQVRYQRDAMAAGGRLSGMLLQIVNGISKLRVSGAEPRAYAAWADGFGLKKQLALKSRNVATANILLASVAPVLNAAAIFAVTAGGLDGAGAPALSTGAFIGFNAAFLQFQTAVLGLGSALVAMLGLVPLHERASPILTALPESASGKEDPGDLIGAIDIQRVSFRYRRDAPLVLRDVSMRIPAGAFVAVVGTSGSGKSTLFRLLLGFEAPESGAIYFDGNDHSQLDVRAVRRQIGVVLQTGRLMAGSIYQNIVGATNLTLEDAWAAAAMAGLDQDIRSMPMGMQTLLGEGGAGLSGGQRQRLMIARAVVRKPRILLFDEATSALDNETQASVSQSLEALKATRVVIAHRLSTIVRANYIYVVDKGEIIQQGTYHDLLREAGPFVELARRQM